jgi:hypothetical protein
MPQPQPRGPRGQSVEIRFRDEITRAIVEGVPLEAMTLRLTLRDASLLARDRATPVADIRYQEGVMHFLGVQVEAGGVAASTLDLGPR